VDEPVGVAAPQMGFAGEAGAGGFGAVVAPDLATVPTADQPAARRFQSGRFTSEGDDGVVQFAVAKGVEVDRGEFVDHRSQAFDESGRHAVLTFLRA
jgi:hypothetical protein